MIVAVVAVVVLAGAGAGAWWLLRPKARPDPVAAAYLEAWGRKDWPAMQAQVAAPPADFARQHTDMVEALRVTEASFTPGTATVTDDRAEVPFQARLRLRALGEWPYQGLLRLVRRDDRWLVDWSPATLHPDLAAGLRFQRTRTWPERAPILAADGSELAGPGPVVTDQRRRRAGQGPGRGRRRPGHPRRGPREAARRPWPTPSAAPTRPSRWSPCPRPTTRRSGTTIYPVPGLSFDRGGGPGVQRPGLGPDAARLGRAGDRRRPQGAGRPLPDGRRDRPRQRPRGGLRAPARRHPVGRGPPGRPGGKDGEAAKVLHEFAGSDGQAVETTLDPLAQEAAEAALDPVAKPAALVAVKPSTGELVAVVNTPFDGYNRALLGRYPPGSTFKVVTAGALLAGGLRPGDPVDCPKEAKVGGRTFGNFEDEVLGRIPFSSAFAHSCNTAFVQQAAKRLDGDELVAAAAQFGFGLDPSPGIPAVTSRVPAPSDTADLAAESFGQGRVTASPLQMALVAATVADGRWRQLVTGDPIRRARTAAADVGGAAARLPEPPGRQGGRPPCGP